MKTYACFIWSFDTLTSAIQHLEHYAVATYNFTTIATSNTPYFHIVRAEPIDITALILTHPDLQIIECSIEIQDGQIIEQQITKDLSQWARRCVYGGITL